MLGGDEELAEKSSRKLRPSMPRAESRCACHLPDAVTRSINASNHLLTSAIPHPLHAAQVLDTPNPAKRTPASPEGEGAGCCLRTSDGRSRPSQEDHCR